jgi:hypothetical protein
MPNTFTMQELVRTAVDEYTEKVESGIPAEVPTTFTIPKGESVRARRGSSRD